MRTLSDVEGYRLANRGGWRNGLKIFFDAQREGRRAIWCHNEENKLELVEYNILPDVDTLTTIWRQEDDEQSNAEIRASR